MVHFYLYLFIIYFWFGFGFYMFFVFFIIIRFYFLFIICFLAAKDIIQLFTFTFGFLWFCLGLQKAQEVGREAKYISGRRASDLDLILSQSFYMYK